MNSNKFYFVSFLLLFSISSIADTYAQAKSAAAIKGTIKDEKTFEPIPYVHVYFKDPVTSLFAGTVTDLEGKFILHLPATQISDTINVTCVGYESLKISSQEFLRRKDHTVMLKQSITTLPTIVFRDLAPRDFFAT